MENLSKKLSIIAYYLSEYDLLGVKELGYKTRSEAFKDISLKLGRENNYLKLRRDEFDVLTNSTRNGWKNRPVIKDVQELFNELSNYDYKTVTTIVKDIIKTAVKETEEAIEEQLEDRRFIEEVDRAVKCNVGKKTIIEAPKPVKDRNICTITKINRDPKVAANALCNADYECEVCANHETFIRKSNGKPYTEPHHLIPMKFQNDFSVSLDVENNIVSLCSNCHNQLHYGVQIDDILLYLFDKRRDLLLKVGLDISYERLLDYYS